MTPELDPARWAALWTAFEELADLEPGDRAQRLEAIGAADPDTRAILERLLSADTGPTPELERMDAIFGATDPRSPPRMASHGDILQLSGQTVGPFTIGEPLAAGGMGIVYRAVDTQLGRPVALKFLRPEQHLDAPAREQFLREARAAGGLDHPNIASIYQAGALEDGRLFLAMPLYEGETLAARLARTGALPVNDAIGFATQIAQGLHAAHRAGVIHRDLKPANLVILPDGGLRILDFGIARVGESTSPGVQARLGTVAYMAPEQLRGEAVDARTDLWALGVVLYEMLTGQRPFAGTLGVAVAQAILHSPPTSPRALRSDVPAALDALILRLLALNPAERPGTAEVVREELQSIAAQVAAPPESLALPGGVRQRVVGRALAAVALVAALWAGLRWLQSNPAPDGAPPRVVAVLPFTLDPSAADLAYLAIGIPDAVATVLSGLPGAAVPEWASVRAFADSALTLSEVAERMEADAVVRGRIRLTGDEVGISLELFDNGHPGRQWTREYQDAGAALPGRMVAELATTLELGPGARVREVLASRPPASAEAWELFLQGRAIELQARPPFGPPPVEALRQAQSYYARAREVEPDFAPARARLASILLAMPPSGETPARQDQARLESETALRQQPGLPEAHEALATYWVQLGDNAAAVSELEQAQAAWPNAPALLGQLGELLPRLGRWDEAVDAFERATRSDPHNRLTHMRAALIHSRLRQYDAAVRHWDRVIALGPEGDAFPRIIRSFALLRHGDTTAFDAGLRALPLGADPGGMTTYAHWMAHRMLGRHREALAVLDSAPGALSADDFVYLPVPLMRAQTLELLGDPAGARASYARARALLADSVAAHPQAPRVRLALALALAGMGRHEAALAEASTATALIPSVAGNTIAATAFRGILVEVYIRAGATDAAFELLDLLLSLPAGREISIPLLQLDPVYDPLRADPRYAELVERFAPAPTRP